MATPRLREGPSLSSSSSPSIPSGQVSRLRATWATAGDIQLAERLQQHEVDLHLSHNRTRNEQLRKDVPHARQVQLQEEAQLQSQLVAQQRLEEEDEQLALQLENDRQYEMMRDQVFVQRILKEAARRTPPLPVSRDGDVPDFEDARFGEQQVPRNEESHVGGARRRVPRRPADEARFWAVPAKADDEGKETSNNNEDYDDSFYAVGKAYNNNNTASASNVGTNDSLLGLSASEMDAALRAEAEIEAERRDRRLAEQLQEELNVDDQELEEKDRALAMQLHEKDQAKLRRAKERSRLKKMQQREQELREQELREQQQKELDAHQMGSDEQDLAPITATPNEGDSLTDSQGNSEPQPNLNHLYARVTQKKKKKNVGDVLVTCGEDSQDGGEPQYANLITEPSNRISRSPLNEAPPYMPLSQQQQQSQQVPMRRKKKHPSGCTQQ